VRNYVPLLNKAIMGGEIRKGIRLFIKFSVLWFGIAWIASLIAQRWPTVFQLCIALNNIVWPSKLWSCDDLYTWLLP